MKRSASQLARASGAVLGNGFIRVRVQLAGLSVSFDRSIELLRVERLEPWRETAPVREG
ncbi:hypothetical protein [Bradyrhizobium sp.]|uniref:hypothetical protein n=1 Tax=Bradyrhizobium sp. TaxID=376 RepID=UPI003C3ABB88